MKSLALKLIITLLVLWALFAQVDLGETISRLTSLSAFSISVGLGIAVLQTVILAYRWLLVTRFANTELQFPDAIRCTFASQFFNQGLPSSIGGDALRIWWLTRLGKATHVAIRSVLLDRIAGLVALAGLNVAAVLVLALVLRGSDSVFNLILSVLLVMLVLVVAASTTARRLFVRCYLVFRSKLHIHKGVAKTARWLIQFHRASARMIWSSKGLEILAWGLFVHIAAVTICYIVAQDVGIDVTLLQLLGVVPPVMLVSYLPLSIGGWGVREGGMAVALTLVGASAADGVFIGLALGSIGLAAALLGALVWVVSPMPVSIFGKRREAVEPHHKAA